MLLLLRVYSLMFLFYNQVFSSLSLFSSFSSIQMYFIFLSRHLVSFLTLSLLSFLDLFSFHLASFVLIFLFFSHLFLIMFFFSVCVSSHLYTFVIILIFPHFVSFPFSSLLCSALTVRLEYWLWLNMILQFFLWVLQSCSCCYNKWFHLNAKESLPQRDFTEMISMLNLNSRRARSFQDLLKMHCMLHHGMKKLLLVSFPRMTAGALQLLSDINVKLVHRRLPWQKANI